MNATGKGSIEAKNWMRGFKLFNLRTWLGKKMTKYILAKIPMRLKY